jgi:membrane protein required for colicin V production
MPIIDILIAAAIAMSVIVGIIRGFVKEAISTASLLVAIWAAMYYGPGISEISDSWTSSADMQAWFGPILVFVVVLSIGGLLGWGISKVVRMSVLSGLDRLAGSAFGAARGVLLVALFVLGGQYAGFDHDRWWDRSSLIPHLEAVADWIRIMAPQGYEILMQHEETI